jgi:protein-disulfide isomerase
MQNESQKQIAGAIIIVGILIAGAILLKGNAQAPENSQKTLSEQVGVDKKEFTQCMESTDLNALAEKTGASAEKAMAGVPANERGTPYSVIIGKNGSRAQIRGAYPKESIQKLIGEVTAGKVTDVYTGEIVDYEEGDHILGSPEAQIIIVEYSDLECPYCKKFGETMKEIVAESNGNVAWVYRHWVVHAGALPKAGAAECVAKIKGNDAFWKYVDLVFGLMDPAAVPISEQL